MANVVIQYNVGEPKHLDIEEWHVSTPLGVPTVMTSEWRQWRRCACDDGVVVATNNFVARRFSKLANSNRTSTHRQLGGASCVLM